MYCKQCGEKLELDARFCGSCGDTVEAPPVPPAPGPNMHAPSPEGVAQTPAPTKKISNAHIGMIACGIVALVILIIGISIFGGRSAESVLRRYLTATANMDFNRALRYTIIDMDDVTNAIMQEMGMTQREFNQELYDDFGVRSMSALLDMVADELRDEMRDEFGRNPRVSIDIYDSFELRRSDRDAVIDRMERDLRWMGIELDDIVRVDRIREMIEFEVDLTISGSGNSLTHAHTVIMVRVGRNWRVWDGTDMFAVW